MNKSIICPHEGTPLTIIHPQFYNFAGNVETGKIAVHDKIKMHVIELFDELLEYKFPIQQMKLLDSFNNNDEASMAANNTVSYGYRETSISKGRKSHHAYGLAIDINPMQNPVIVNGTYTPKNATNDIKLQGTLTPEVVRIFKKHGFLWGGDWHFQDLHHFSWANSEELVDGLLPETHENKLKEKPL